MMDSADVRVPAGWESGSLALVSTVEAGPVDLCVAAVQGTGAMILVAHNQEASMFLTGELWEHRFNDSGEEADYTEAVDAMVAVSALPNLLAAEPDVLPVPLKRGYQACRILVENVVSQTTQQMPEGLDGSAEDSTVDPAAAVLFQMGGLSDEVDWNALAGTRDGSTATLFGLKVAFMVSEKEDPHEWWFGMVEETGTRFRPFSLYVDPEDSTVKVSVYDQPSQEFDWAGKWSDHPVVYDDFLVGRFAAATEYYGNDMVGQVAEKVLTPEQYFLFRNAVTESPGFEPISL